MNDRENRPLGTLQELESLVKQSYERIDRRLARTNTYHFVNVAEMLNRHPGYSPHAVLATFKRLSPMYAVELEVSKSDTVWLVFKRITPPKRIDPQSDSRKK